MSSLKILTKGRVAVIIGSDGSGGAWLGEVHVCGARTVLWLVFGVDLRQFVIMVPVVVKSRRWWLCQR